MPARLIKIIFVALFCAGMPHTAYSQALDDAFLRSTVLVAFSTGPMSQSVGSGFLLFRPVSDNQGQVYLITNKHVLPSPTGPDNITIRVNIKSAANPQVQDLPVPIYNKKKQYLPTVRFHPNPGYDVAAVNITEQVARQGIEGVWLPYDLLVTDERLKDEHISIGDDIFLLGYPDGIFDQRNVSPILRRGVLATSPNQGYAFNERLRRQYGLPERIDGFLIDAGVFPGSSGSVVILAPQPTTLGARGETVVSSAKKIPYVLGVVSGSIPIADSALGSVQRLGLGVVYGTKTIREVVELFYSASAAYLNTPLEPSR
ncbi:MAG TPA: hypothetical protein DCZ75_03795 [Geobacter sp.]|nr:hypothetical protein [Geobacter sp.]